MEWNSHLFVGTLLISTALTTAGAVLVWRRALSTRLRVSSIALLICSSAWSALYAAELLSTQLSSKIFWSKLQFLPILTVPTVFLIFAIACVGHGDWLNRRTIGILAIVPSAAWLMVATNEFHQLMWTTTTIRETGGLSTLVHAYGPAFWLQAAYSYSLVTAGTITLTSRILQQREMYGLSVIAAAPAGVVPAASRLAYSLNACPLFALDLTPIALTAGSGDSLGAFARSAEGHKGPNAQDCSRNHG